MKGTWGWVTPALLGAALMVQGPSLLLAQDICDGSGVDEAAYLEIRGLLCAEAWDDLQKKVLAMSYLTGAVESLEDTRSAELARTLLRFVNRIDEGIPVSADELLQAVSGSEAEPLRQAIRHGSLKLAFKESELKLWCQSRSISEANLTRANKDTIAAIEFAVRCAN